MKLLKWLKEAFTPTTPEQHEENGYQYAWGEFAKADDHQEKEEILKELEMRSYGSEDGFDKGIRRFLNSIGVK